MVKFSDAWILRWTEPAPHHDPDHYLMHAIYAGAGWIVEDPKRAERFRSQEDAERYRDMYLDGGWTVVKACEERNGTV